MLKFKNGEVIDILIQIIGETSDITTAALKDELSVSISVDNQFERCYHPTQFSPPEADHIPIAKIKITLRTNVPLTKIKLSIEVQPPLAATKSSYIVNSLSKLYGVLFKNLFINKYLHNTMNI